MARLGRGYPPRRVSPPTLPVLFDAVGAGTTGGSSAASGNLSFNHNISGNAIVLFIHWGSTNNLTGAVSATVGGVSMTNLYPADWFGWQYGTSGVGFQIVPFGLLNPPSGVQSVKFSWTGLNNIQDFALNSLSYFNAGSFGAAQTNASASGTSASLSMTSTLGRGAQMFGSNATLGGQAISAYNQTSRWNQPCVASVAYPAVLGDAAGTAGTVNFTATVPVSPWGGLGIPVNPLPSGGQVF